MVHLVLLHQGDLSTYTNSIKHVMQASLHLSQAGKLEIHLEYKQIYFYTRYVIHCLLHEEVKNYENPNG